MMNTVPMTWQHCSKSTSGTCRIHCSPATCMLRSSLHHVSILLCPVLISFSLFAVRLCKKFRAKKFHLSRFLFVSGLKEASARLSALHDLIALLPATNRDTLWALLEFLCRVVQHSTDAIDTHGNQVCVALIFHVGYFLHKDIDCPPPKMVRSLTTSSEADKVTNFSPEAAPSFLPPVENS